MRSLIPRPVLLALTLLLVAGAIALIELHFDAAGPGAANARQSSDPPDAEKATRSIPAPKRAGPAEDGEMAESEPALTGSERGR